MKDRKLGIGIIGAGGIAEWEHMPAWKDIPEVKVLALADVNLSRAKEMADKFEVSDTFENYKGMLKMGEIDIIDICTPNYAHHPAAIASLNAGKHVICEKPLAITPQQVKEMIGAAKKNRKKLCAIQNHRFNPKVQSLKKMILNGELGEIYYVRAQALRQRGVPGQPTFYKKALSGGGPVLDIGVHILDLSYWLMGCPVVKSVSGVTLTKLAKQTKIEPWGDWNSKDYEVEDFAVGLVKFKNGANMLLEASFLLNMKETEIFRTSIFGTKAGIQYSAVEGDKWEPSAEIYKEKHGMFMVNRIIEKQEVKTHEELIRAFVKCVREGGPEPVPPEQSQEVIKILDGIYRSGKTGKEIII